MHCATESETGRLRKSAIRASTGSRRRTAMRRESQRTSPDPQRDKEAKQGEGGKRETEREKGAEKTETEGDVCLRLGIPRSAPCQRHAVPGLTSNSRAHRPNNGRRGGK